MQGHHSPCSRAVRLREAGKACGLSRKRARAWSALGWRQGPLCTCFGPASSPHPQLGADCGLGCSRCADGSGCAGRTRPSPLPRGSAQLPPAGPSSTSPTLCAPLQNLGSHRRMRTNPQAGPPGPGEFSLTVGPLGQVGLHGGKGGGLTGKAGVGEAERKRRRAARGFSTAPRDWRL